MKNQTAQSLTAEKPVLHLFKFRLAKVDSSPDNAGAACHCGKVLPRSWQSYLSLCRDRALCDGSHFDSCSNRSLLLCFVETKQLVVCQWQSERWHIPTHSNPNTKVHCFFSKHLLRCIYSLNYFPAILSSLKCSTLCIFVLFIIINAWSQTNTSLTLLSITQFPVQIW